MTDPHAILPTRRGETDDEQRLREAINRLAGQMLGTLDAALALRTAPQASQRARHVARGHLVEFAVMAMHAMALKESADGDATAK